MNRAARVAASLLIVVLAVFCGLAIRYWIPWPAWLRDVGALLFPVAVLGLWFAPGRLRRARRGMGAVLLAVLLGAYWTKAPVAQNWRDLHAEEAVSYTHLTLPTKRIV